MKYIIYKTTNKINGKIYIGKHQTDNINDGYMGSGKLLKSAIKKYGIENFVKEILHVFDTEEEINNKEAELVTEEFCLREDTYNICVGGKGGFSHINRDKETQKTTAALGGATTFKKHGTFMKKDRINSKEAIENRIKTKKQKYRNGELIPPFKGKSHSLETKKKMSESAKIRKTNSQTGTMWITNGFENKKIKSVDFIPEGWYKGRVI